jgi:hypothetical protein
VLTPAFNDIMSPKTAGEKMRTYAEDGCGVASCGVPYGTYNYYAHVRVIPEVSGRDAYIPGVPLCPPFVPVIRIPAADVLAFLAAHPRAVVAIRGTSLDAIRPALPADIKITAKHVLELKPHFLLVKNQPQISTDHTD